MNTKIINSKTMEKSFFKFIIPSTISTLLGGFYIIVDGFFVGNIVGDVGLAAIGLIYPVGTLLLSTGLMAGVGGAVVMSTFLGEHNIKKANEARANTFIMLLFLSVTMTAVLFLLKQNILHYLGAEGEVYKEANAYISVIISGGSMQIISSGLMPIVRNSGKTIRAMLIMVSGFIINVILDAFFMIVLKMGVRGSAVATIIAEAIVTILAVLSIVRQKENKVRASHFTLNLNMIKRMLFIGLSPFGLTLAPSLIVVFNNWQCLKYGGNIAVSAYSVINYIIGFVMYFFEGISEGLQPMISYFKGAKEYKLMKKTLKKGVLVIVILSISLLLTAVFYKENIAKLFGASYEVLNIIMFALPVMAVAFPIQAIVRLGTSYFYASGESKYSTLLTYIDPLFVSPLCIIILPRYFNLAGVWLAFSFAQIIVVLLFIILLNRHRNNIKEMLKLET